MGRTIDESREALRDPVLRRAMFGAFLNFHVWVLTAMLGALASWVWATDDSVKALQQDVQHREEVIQAIPRIERDIEVLKEKAQSAEKVAVSANQKLDRITELMMGLHGNGRN